MNYNQTTRQQLYNNFINTHQPKPIWGLLYGADTKDVFSLFTTPTYNYTEKQKKLYDNIAKSMNGSRLSPGKYFKTHYGKIVEFCAGSKTEAALLYQHFDKLNRFQYSAGWDRRTVRTKTYINPLEKIKHILYAAYHLQIYNCTLDRYLLNDLNEELLDYKSNKRMSWPGLEGMIAAHLDAGDKAVKDALIQIITGDNNAAFITNSMIRGIFKSDDTKLHLLLGQLLVAARLQEGLRQAICENMDCGTIEAFRIIFDVIEEHNLLRFSSVRRAVATWIGILDPDHLIRTSNKTFLLMREVIHYHEKAYELIESNDAMSILVGLWGLGSQEVDNAVEVMKRIVVSGTIQQKRVAAFYNKCIDNKKTQRIFANKLIESPELDIELAAGIFDTYMSDCHSEALCAAGSRIGAKDNPRPVDLKLWFPDKDTARKHLHILMELLQKMNHKKYQFSPYVFPWYFTNITQSNVMVRICAIANGLLDDDLMDQLAEHIPELDSQDNSRLAAVRLLLSRPVTEKRREILIQTLGDKESYTRREALEIAKKLTFTQKEYDLMCSLLRFKAADLRFKAADLRVNIISLLKEQNAGGLEHSLRLLLTDKKAEIRLAGLDILRSLIQESEYKNKNPQIEHTITIGKNLAAEIAKPTEQEQIILKEILEEKTAADISIDEMPLYNEADIIVHPALSCNDNAYPLFHISKDRLQTLFGRLDDLIDEYKNEEIKTAYGEKVLLGNQNFLPNIKYTGTPEEKYPLVPVWKHFYETEIKNPSDLTAMFLALSPYEIAAGYGNAKVMDKSYNTFIRTLAENIFGKTIIEFEPSSYRYGKVPQRGISYAVSGGDLFRDILKVLMEIYCDADYRHTLGRHVAEYLCCHVPANKRMFHSGLRNYSASVKTFITPLNALLFDTAISGFSQYWCTKEQFETRFHILRVMEEHFLHIPEENSILWASHNLDHIRLRSLDYVLAAYYGIISEAQMYRQIFDPDKLKGNLQNLFLIWRVERYPGLKQQISKYGISENTELEQYIRSVANITADRVVKVECKRGDSHTPFSKAVSSIEFFYGVDHLINLLTALGKEKLVRTGSYGTAGDGSKTGNLCHLISVCHPSPEDTAETFSKALEGTSITEKRLIETAMYAPQWIDFIEEHLHFTGLKSGAFYFMAHMNDQYNRDQRKFATIARFTPLEKEELFNGAFDIDWFEDAYSVLGEKRFQLLYDAAKYSSDGSRHTRARKYADAALGKVKTNDLEAEIIAKRNKDLLMSYPLIPLTDKTDMLHRYEFIQKFRKESTQFGSQRRTSEGLACDMAMRNLATRAGFKDVTRLTLVMENALAESLKSYFQWNPIENGKDTAEACIQVSASGKPEVLIRKGEKTLASIPAAFKKHPYILSLKESNKKFREQYSRTIKMFELSMEERELYTVEEICSLTNNPVIAPIVENLVYIDENGICGLVRPDGNLGLVDETGTIISLPADGNLRVAHPYDLYQSGRWPLWQKFFFEKQKQDGSKQPFRQVFRELYVKLEEELDQKYTRMFAGHQIQPAKTVACLKGRRWIADHETGLEKVFYKDNIAVTMYALANWFSPSDIEPPTLEYVSFSDRKTFKTIPIGEVPDIVYSEALRDVDLAVSVAHAGSVDPEASHSSIEMRKVIAECNIELFGLKNVTIEGSHAFIKGSLGEYTVHLGSGVVHMRGVHQLNVLPVHSQHRGRIFLPFLDEDPKTAEIISMILLFANDKKIKDPYILNQM